MEIGDRVRVGVLDRYGQPLYGVVLSKGVIGVLVRCDSLVSKKYCCTDSRDIIFDESMLQLCEADNDN